MGVDSLKVLENRVDAVLSKHSAVGRERDRLRAQVRQVQARIDAAAKELRESERDRREIRARIESILSRLEGLDLT